MSAGHSTDDAIFYDQDVGTVEKIDRLGGKVVMQVSGKSRGVRAQSKFTCTVPFDDFKLNGGVIAVGDKVTRACCTWQLA